MCSLRSPFPRALTTMDESLCINTIRVLAADMVTKANSGHPGAPLGCAPMAYLLWSEMMNYAPKEPEWVWSSSRAWAAAGAGIHTVLVAHSFWVGERSRTATALCCPTATAALCRYARSRSFRR